MDLTAVGSPLQDPSSVCMADRSVLAEVLYKPHFGRDLFGPP